MGDGKSSKDAAEKQIFSGWYAVLHPDLDSSLSTCLRAHLKEGGASVETSKGKGKASRQPKQIPYGAKSVLVAPDGADDEECNLMLRRCGSVVLPQWVIASVLCGRALPTELYSTRVQLPLRGLLISLALLDKSRADVLGPVIEHMGGNFTRGLHPLCTHIVLSDESGGAVPLVVAERMLKPREGEEQADSEEKAELLGYLESLTFPHKGGDARPSGLLHARAVSEDCLIDWCRRGTRLEEDLPGVHVMEDDGKFEGLVVQPTSARTALEALQLTDAGGRGKAEALKGEVVLLDWTLQGRARRRAMRMVLEMGGKLAEQGASITVRAWGSPNGEGLVVSPTWLSICWKEGRKVAASGHGDVLDVLLRPREGEGEVEGCRRTIVCISGFTSSTDPPRRLLTLALEALGVCITGPMLTGLNTHVVCHTFSGTKFDVAKAASKRPCHTVTAAWATASALAGRLLPEGPYLDVPVLPAKTPARRTSMSPAPSTHAMISPRSAGGSCGRLSTGTEVTVPEEEEEGEGGGRQSVGTVVSEGTTVRQEEEEGEEVDMLDDDDQEEEGGRRASDVSVGGGTMVDVGGSGSRRGSLAGGTRRTTLRGETQVEGGSGARSRRSSGVVATQQDEEAEEEEKERGRRGSRGRPSVVVAETMLVETMMEEEEEEEEEEGGGRRSSSLPGSGRRVTFGDGRTQVDDEEERPRRSASPAMEEGTQADVTPASSAKASSRRRRSSATPASDASTRKRRTTLSGETQVDADLCSPRRSVSPTSGHGDKQAKEVDAEEEEETEKAGAEPRHPGDDEEEGDDDGGIYDLDVLELSGQQQQEAEDVVAKSFHRAGRDEGRADEAMQVDDNDDQEKGEEEEEEEKEKQQPPQEEEEQQEEDEEGDEGEEEGEEEKEEAKKGATKGRRQAKGQAGGGRAAKSKAAPKQAKGRKVKGRQEEEEGEKKTAAKAARQGKADEPAKKAPKRKGRTPTASAEVSKPAAAKSGRGAKAGGTKRPAAEEEVEAEEQAGKAPARGAKTSAAAPAAAKRKAAAEDKAEDKPAKKKAGGRGKRAPLGERQNARGPEGNAETGNEEEGGADTRKKRAAQAAGQANGYRFALGRRKGGEGVEVGRLASIVEHLGGSYVGQTEGGEDVFDESVTHVVVHDLRRTAKLLGGCLAGKWVLRPDYLDACAAAGRFVEEAEYEWGAREEDGPQAAVCGRWRRAGGQPLKGWKVLLYESRSQHLEPPLALMASILRAGGATVRSASGTFSPLGMPSGTVVISSPHIRPDPALRDWATEKQQQGQRGGHVCLSAKFILDTVSSLTPPNPKDHLLFGSCPDDATLEALRFAPPTEEEEAEKPQPAGKGRKKRSAPATTARAEAAEKAVKKSRKK